MKSPYFNDTMHQETFIDITTVLAQIFPEAPEWWVDRAEEFGLLQIHFCGNGGENTKTGYVL